MILRPGVGEKYAWRAAILAAFLVCVTLVSRAPHATELHESSDMRFVIFFAAPALSAPALSHARSVLIPPLRSLCV